MIADGRIVGAILLGPGNDVAAVRTAITRGFDVSPSSRSARRAPRGPGQAQRRHARARPPPHGDGIARCPGVFRGMKPKLLLPLVAAAACSPPRRRPMRPSPSRDDDHCHLHRRLTADDPGAGRRRRGQITHNANGASATDFAGPAFKYDGSLIVTVNSGDGNDTINLSAPTSRRDNQLRRRRRHRRRLRRGRHDQRRRRQRPRHRLPRRRHVNGGDGNDVMIWNNGDGTDINHGGNGIDETLVTPARPTTS